MPLERDQYTVYVQTDPLMEPKEYTAVITHQDMLRGETAVLGEPGMNLKHGLLLTTAWCWAALMRQGDYAGAWQTFRDVDCAGIDTTPEAVAVDPTQPVTTDASV